MPQASHHESSEVDDMLYRGPRRCVRTPYDAARSDTMTAPTVQGPSHHQPFPTMGTLYGNVNLDVGRLTQRLGAAQGTVYCYVVATVQYVDGQFVQTGSAPNFQGGLLTLCTCKHQMRAGKPESEWPGIWIAGVTGISEGPQGPDRSNYLFYLMQVEQTFASQRDLWEWLLEYAPAAAQAKRADENCLGDVYVPKAAGGNPYNLDTYQLPCPGHRHWPTAWHYDITYCGRNHPSALLVGNPRYSFLWSELCVPIPFRVGRGCRIATLRAIPGSERPSLL